MCRDKSYLRTRTEQSAGRPRTATAQLEILLYVHIRQYIYSIQRHVLFALKLYRAILDFVAAHCKCDKYRIVELINSLGEHPSSISDIIRRRSRNNRFLIFDESLARNRARRDNNRVAIIYSAELFVISGHVGGGWRVFRSKLPQSRLPSTADLHAQAVSQSLCGLSCRCRVGRNRYDFFFVERDASPAAQKRRRDMKVRRPNASAKGHGERPRNNSRFNCL